MKISESTAIWRGSLKEGEGKIQFNSIDYEVTFNYETRFGNEKGMSPEELIGAALAGCFSMALADILTKEGHSPTEIKTSAHVITEMTEHAFRIAEIQLSTVAKIDNIDESVFLKFAEDTMENCPVSRALEAVDISLKAKLINIK